MKQAAPFLCYFFLTLLLASCGNNPERKLTTHSENDIDAARNFLRSILDGDYEKAKTYMLVDSTNMQDLMAVQRVNERLSADEKSRFRESSITIFDTHKENDSVSVITFSNTYKQMKDSIRIIKINGTWKADLKFVFKTDSLIIH